MIKIGLLGAGHLGKIHLRLIKEIEAFTLVGFYDPDPAVAAKVAEEYGIKAFDKIEELITQVDAVDIVTPTLSHFDCATIALDQGKHIFIEKPLTHTLQEAETLIERVEELKVVAQVGHVERFNPAFLALQDESLNPMFIEGHRLAFWNPRGTDVSVVLDLMIHDLDVVLSMVPSEIESISASGVSVISDQPDIANARIEFVNGCVANLTASRISIKNMRRLRFFQPNTYVAVDFLKKKTEIFQIQDEPGEMEGQQGFEFDLGDNKRYLNFQQPEIDSINSIKMELEEFAASISGGAPVRVSIQDGYRALKAAHQILEAIDQRKQQLS